MLYICRFELGPGDPVPEREPRVPGELRAQPRQPRAAAEVDSLERTS